MAAGINISLVSNVRDFIRGTQDASKGLDDVIDSLEDVADEGDRTQRDLARDFKDTSREAETTAEKMEREFAEAFKQVKRESKDAGRDVSRDMDKAAREGSDAFDEFKSEATQNFSQIASSFTGDMTSAVDLVQGTLGGLAGSIPGIGMVLGGLGAVAGVMAAQWQESTEKAKQRVSDMYDDMLQSGEAFLSESYKQNEYWSIIRDESVVLSRKKAEEYATLAGMTFQEVALAFAGNTEKMIELQDRLNAKRDEYYQKMQAASGEERIAHGEQMSWYEEIIEATQRRAAEIEATSAEVSKSQAAWKAWGTEASAALDESRRQMGQVYDQLGTIREAAERLPNPTIKVNVDTSDIHRQVQGALSRKQFTAYVNARTQTQGVGKQVY